jgi:hypothetical protein
VKPQTGTTAKTQNPGTAKPAGTTDGALKATPGQNPQPTSGTAVAKKAAVPLDTATGATNNPAIVEVKPKPKPLDAAPQTTPQTPANENSPQ